MRELRYAVRCLPEHPASHSSRCITLALGIGANPPMFSVIDNVLLEHQRPRSPGFDRLAVVWETDEYRNVPRTGLVSPDFLDYRQRSPGGWTARGVHRHRNELTPAG